MIVLQEPTGSDSDLFCKLHGVPPLLRNALFVYFHVNPIGGHLTACRTHVFLWLQYCWPGMYKYCMHKYRQCPGCALFNSTMKINKLAYEFPIDVPFNVLHVDGYKPCAHFNFEGTDSYIIAAYGMTGFVACEPVTDESVTTYALVVMKTMLQRSINHTFVLDKYSKFLGIFRQVVDVL